MILWFPPEKHDIYSWQNLPNDLGESVLDKETLRITKIPSLEIFTSHMKAPQA